MNMNFTKTLILALKGCAMGMADVVPGVSGGTIAFISGIYEELIASIRNLDLTALKDLLHGRFRLFWHHVNGSFLLPVLCGVAISILSLAKVMTFFLEYYPIQIWSFFFGLIIASAFLVAKQISKWNWSSVLMAIVGIAVAWWITVASPAETPDDWWFVMLSGAVAICAMILPGISGAFILLLLGKYQYIMLAVGNLNIPVIVIFMAGAGAGIIAFSHLLSWLLKEHHDPTIALLMGFMLGSLNKVWPWKETVTSIVDKQGKMIPVLQENITPNEFEALTGADSCLLQGISLCIVGLFTIYAIELAARILLKKRGQ